jgi:hypothetical protein
MPFRFELIYSNQYGKWAVTVAGRILGLMETQEEAITCMGQLRRKAAAQEVSHRPIPASQRFTSTPREEPTRVRVA